MNTEVKKTNLILNIGLWVAQILVASMFLMGAVMKLTTPIPELSKMMPWTGQVNPMLVYVTGVFDGLGGLGLILPALTRIQPRLTVLAAIGCLLLQICALVFHSVRGEFATVGMLNVILIALSVFIIWGRSTKAPIYPR